MFNKLTSKKTASKYYFKAVLIILTLSGNGTILSLIPIC